MGRKTNKFNRSGSQKHVGQSNHWNLSVILCWGSFLFFLFGYPMNRCPFYVQFCFKTARRWTITHDLGKLSSVSSYHQQWLGNYLSFSQSSSLSRINEREINYWLCQLPRETKERWKEETVAGIDPDLNHLLLLLYCTLSAMQWYFDSVSRSVCLISEYRFNSILMIFTLERGFCF